MRLFRVTVEYELVIAAETDHEAETLGESLIHGEDGSECLHSNAIEITEAAKIPHGWHQAIPFGGDETDERTCSQRLTPCPATPAA